MKKKLMLAIAFSCCIWEANAKICKCGTEKVTYEWFVGDKQACSQGTGTADKIINHGSYSERITVPVQEAIDFC